MPFLGQAANDINNDSTIKSSNDLFAALTAADVGMLCFFLSYICIYMYARLFLKHICEFCPLNDTKLAQRRGEERRGAERILTHCVLSLMISHIYSLTSYLMH